MELRRAVPDDAQALSTLSAACFTQTFGHLYPPRDLSHFLDEAYAVSAWASLLSDPAYATWLLESDGIAIGYATAGACTLPHADVAPVDGELKRLYVLQEHQGGGRGSRLFDAALAWLLRDGRRTLWIGVWSGTSARSVSTPGTGSSEWATTSSWSAARATMSSSCVDRRSAPAPPANGRACAGHIPPTPSFP